VVIIMEHGGFTLDGMKVAVEAKKTQFGPVIRPFCATLPEYGMQIASRNL
jgi:hypothetical protein